MNVNIYFVTDSAFDLFIFKSTKGVFGFVLIKGNPSCFFFHGALSFVFSLSKLSFKDHLMGIVKRLENENRKIMCGVVFI